MIEGSSSVSINDVVVGAIVSKRRCLRHLRWRRRHFMVRTVAGGDASSICDVGVTLIGEDVAPSLARGSIVFDTVGNIFEGEAHAVEAAVNVMLCTGCGGYGIEH